MPHNTRKGRSNKKGKGNQKMVGGVERLRKETAEERRGEPGKSLEHLASLLLGASPDLIVTSNLDKLH
jgi:hypothetical protein